MKKKACIMLAVMILISLCFSSSHADISILKTGDVGENVEKVQRLLKYHGLYSEPIDGVYDSALEQSVRRFQLLVGAKSDGIFGPETYTKYLHALANGVFNSHEQVNPDILNGKIIGIDPMYQADEDLSFEQISPESERTKPKMSKGVSGIKTGTQECEINLVIALKLKTMLENAGATVIISRSESNVSISNIERAEIMNDAGVDIWLRICCNSSKNSSTNGAIALVPSRFNNYDKYKSSLLLGKSVISGFCKSTKAENLSVKALSDQAGFNWSDNTVITLSLGYLSNANEDSKLNRSSYQIKCAEGLFDGIVEYYSKIADATQE